MRNWVLQTTTQQSLRSALVALGVLLYVLGLSVLFWMQYRYQQSQTAMFAENMPILIELKDSIPESEAMALQTHLESQKEVLPKSVLYVSRSDAKLILKDDFSAEELSLLSDSLLPNMIEFRLRTDYLPQAQALSEELRKAAQVKEVYLPDSTWFAAPSSGWFGLWFTLLVILVLLSFLGFILWQVALKSWAQQHRPLLQTLHYAGADPRQVAQAFYERSFRLAAYPAGFSLLGLWLSWGLLLLIMPAMVLSLSFWNIFLATLLVLALAVLMIYLGTRIALARYLHYFYS
jgi:hypothetical protein